MKGTSTAAPLKIKGMRHPKTTADQIQFKGAPPRSRSLNELEFGSLSSKTPLFLTADRIGPRSGEPQYTYSLCECSLQVCMHQIADNLYHGLRLEFAGSFGGCSHLVKVCEP